MGYRAETAVSPTTGKRTWLVVDDDFEPHAEARSYALALDGIGSSPNTSRTYIPKVAHFLSWCQAHALDWRSVDLAAMSRYKHFVEARGGRNGQPVSGKTVNIYLVAAIEFLRYCATQGLADAELVTRFHERRQLRYVPDTAQLPESGDRGVTVRRVRAREADKDPQVISDKDLDTIEASCKDARERMLFTLLRETGMRIGEVLGLHREDLHLLPDSTAFGCRVAGAHLHVVRRINSNGAFAKTNHRTIPLPAQVIDEYVEYMLFREEMAPRSSSPFLLVNLHDAVDRRDRPMTYSNVKRIVNRWAQLVEGPITPHMFRHTAATKWLREGAGVDVVQELLGHANAASTHVYLHPHAEDMRAAVESLAAKRSAR